MGDRGGEEHGKLLREERLKDALGEYYAQPVAGDGKIYFINKDGMASVIRAGKDWAMLSSDDLGKTNQVGKPGGKNCVTGRLRVRAVP